MASNGLSTPLAIVVGVDTDVELLAQLLAGVPRDVPGPIVVAHPAVARDGRAFVAALTARSALPVHLVVERMDLVPGAVYVVPLGVPVELDARNVSVRGDGEASEGTIDDLLASAAHVYGEDLIIVLLSAADGDGALGARVVKEAGGMVVVLSSVVGQYPALPASLPPSLVDIAVMLDGVGPLLHDLLSRLPTPTEPEEERALGVLLAQLRDRSGIDFTAYKPPTIMRRLQRRMAAIGVERLVDYLRYLQEHPDEYQRLVSSFLIKVTEFFRDGELFAYLREHVLPQLIAEARERNNELRLWSAGCATGEEVYSLAILILELLGERGDSLSVRIFATDLDGDAVAFARHGIYPRATVAGVPPELVERYFTQLGNEYEIKKRVRSTVIFGQHDLGQRAPFPRIDLALCRNVLIYFTTELQRPPLQLFAFSLRPGGYLVLGKSETPRPLAEFFTLEEPRLKVYRRQGERVLIPPARIRDTTPVLPYPLTSHRPLATGLELARMQRESQRSRGVRERAERLLLHLPLGVVVVDRRYDIQVINTTARQLLGIHGPAIGEDLVHLAAHLNARRLRAAIDAAFRGEATTETHEVSLPEAASPETRHLELRTYGHVDDPETGAVAAAVVAISDCTASVRERQALEERYQQAQAEVERARAAVEALTESNRQLLAANLELTTSNAELRSANDDLLVVNEEVQAATEEIETLNEELQASNEELETLNEELQSTVEELNTTNDDLQSRSLGLQELATMLEEQRRSAEAERARLEAVLASMSDALMMVDSQGHVVQANAAYTELFGSPDALWTAEDEEGRPLPAGDSPGDRAARGETFTQQFVVTQPGGSRRRLEATGRPLRGAELAGGVVVIRDITDRGHDRPQE